VKIAAVDCGTNSFHLLVARVGADGVIEPLDRAKEMVRLGDSAFKGVITEEATTRAVDAIRRFRGIAERGGVDAIIAVATSAVREAENGGDFVRIVRDETGIELTVIRGDEEARLIYLGAKAALNLAARRALVVDIGGGSVELIVGDSRDVHYATSLKLGVLRLLDQFTLSDPITPDQRAKLAEHMHRVLEAAMGPVQKIGFEVLAMTSGTARQVAELVPSAIDEKDKLRRVAFKDVYQLEERMCMLPSAERAKIPGLDARRIDSIVPGCVLVRAILETAHADEYVMCETALREGLVADYAARNRPSITLVDEFPDPRRRSIVGLMRRCNANVPHAQQVARLALDLFRGTRPLHNLPNSDGELLEFAALLHDIGFHVASSKHHKHAAYLIENAELKGFSPDEILVLSQVARYHRKATPKETHEGFARLSAANRDKVRMLAALLRIADGLDRGYAQVVRSVRVRVPDKSDKNVEVTLSTKGEPELEVWGARRKGDLFQEVFGKKLKFAVEREE
jgi:exopolyphosphatase/guanosine-5'-triphosphate,3'-diphosphate pyrophosphatase